MKNEEKVSEIKDTYEQKEAISCIVEIEKQKKAPSRDGMIKVIIKCQNYASSEIKQIEQRKGEHSYIPFAVATDEQLYNKMVECQQAIYNHCVDRLGEEIVKSIIKELLN